MPDEVAGRNGWTRVAFGDVVRQVRDRVDPDVSGLERFVAGEHMDTDDLRIRRWGVIGDGYLGPAFHMRFKPGHVLYGSRRTYLRKVAVADFDGITANTTFVMEAKDPGVLLPELLPFIMQTESFHRHSIKQSKGSVNPYVNFSDLAWYEFALPPPEEQRRIANLLHAGRAAMERLLGAEQVAKTLYRAAGAEKLARQGSIGVDPIDWAPPCWECTSLRELVLESAPICYGIVQVGDYDESGVPTLAIKDLRGNFTSGVHRTTQSVEARYTRSRVQPGDVLISIKATIGEIAIVPDGFTGNISRDLARLRINPAKLRPHFFLHLFRSPRYTQYVESRLVGSTRAELSIAVLQELAVPIPPLDAQDRLVEKLDALLRVQQALGGRAALVSELNRRMLGVVLSAEGAAR